MMMPSSANVKPSRSATAWPMSYPSAPLEWEMQMTEAGIASDRILRSRSGPVRRPDLWTGSHAGPTAVRARLGTPTLTVTR